MINVSTTGTVTGSITASTISFTSSNIINDSGAGFGFVSPGDYIRVTGSTGNSADWYVVSATASDIVVWVSNRDIVAEIAGASITISKGVGISLIGSVGYIGEPIVLVHPETVDLRDGKGFAAYEISEDTLLQAALDSASLAMNADGKTITTSTELKKLGSGIGGLQDLEETLAEGNTTGANDIIVDTAQKIEFGEASGIEISQDGFDSTLNVNVPDGMVITVANVSGIVDLGGTYIAAVDDGGSGNSIQMDSTGGTQITWTQNFGTGTLRLKPVTLTTGRDIFFPDASGTVALTSDIAAATVAMKSGVEAFTSFTGTPRKATITFSSAFANALYSVAITGSDGRIFTVESQAAGSFVINTNDNTALTADVSWTAIKHGETS